MNVGACASVYGLRVDNVGLLRLLALAIILFQHGGLQRRRGGGGRLRSCGCTLVVDFARGLRDAGLESIDLVLQERHIGSR